MYFISITKGLGSSRGIEVAIKEDQIITNKIFFKDSQKLSNSFLTVFFVVKLLFFLKKVSKMSKPVTLIIYEETFF